MPGFDTPPVKIYLMKKTTFAILTATVLAGSAWAGKPVPYQSDFYIDYTLDDGWTMKNNVRRGGISWSAAGISDDLLAINAKGAAKKIYSSDQTQTADTWLISPAVDVTAGTAYTVSIYARTVASYGETESFKITAASSAEISALKSGTVILDKKSYSNTGGYEELTATFTPETSGEVYFGVQCYSEPDMDHLFLTHFSVSDGSGGGGGEDPKPPVEGKELPYSFDFKDESVFTSDWQSVAGPDAVVTTPWTYATMGYANWDFTQNKKEDNWLISPPLAVEKAGSYAIDSKVWANGKLELMLGTDPADLSSFSLVNTFEDTSFPNDSDRPTRDNVSITEPGTYYLAFRACSEEGTYMGHRVYYAGFKENVVTPAIVTDLKAVADLTDELSVSLSWTYPSLTNTGKELQEIVKAEVYRGDLLINTFHYPRPGTSWACEDSGITEPGVYSYTIVIYGENGPDTDNAPIPASSGYVGKPVISFPCDINLSNDKETAAMCTVEDNNNDGETWMYDYESWVPAFISANPGDAVMDDYLSTPYITLQTGYYLVNFKVGGRNNTYELGYVTNRHLQAETFVKIAEVSDDASVATTDHKFVVVIPEDGDYCLTIHHTGAMNDPSSTYYNSVKFDGFSIAAQAILPETPSELEAVAADDNSLKATISWRNPSLDNGGCELTELAKAVIYRDGDEIATVTENLLPGEVSSYDDEAVPTAGEHIYKVEVHNANGCSENDAPEISVFVGPGLELPYQTYDFEGWKSLNLNGDWYEWEKDYSDIFGFSQSWGDDPDDYALSPFIELPDNHKFRLTVETHAGGTLEVDLVTGNSYDPSKLTVAGKLAAESDEKAHVFDFQTSGSSVPATASEEEVSALPLTPGKNTLGFHASSTGSFKLKSFQLVDNGPTSGGETIFAAVAGVSYSAGIVRTSALASSISVYAIDGTCLMEASNVAELDLTPLAKGQTVVISAITGGKLQTLKVVL